MSAKRSRAFRAGFDSLERRETPSAHGLAATSTAKLVNIHGTGIAVVTSSLPVVNGQQIATSVSGQSTVLGKYTGDFNSFFGLSLAQGSGTGAIRAADGDLIDLSLSGVFGTENKPQIHIPGIIHLKVTGGTGAFANATGHGTLTGQFNTFPNTFTFTFHARVRE
jgi:hypothetical protein